jgi:hypothetical protein
MTERDHRSMKQRLKGNQCKNKTINKLSNQKSINKTILLSQDKNMEAAKFGTRLD